MDFFDKLEEHINIPETPQDMSPEREEKLINGLLTYINNHGLELPALLFFETVQPISSITGTFGQAFAMAWLDIFGRNFFTDLMLLFQKRGGLEKLIMRIQEQMDSKR